MKRLILTATLAMGLLAACSPAATPSVRVVTPEPSLPSASGLSTLTPSSGASAGSSLSPSRTP
jgi:hypothetical protein